MANPEDCEPRIRFFDSIRVNGLDIELSDTHENIRTQLKPDATSAYTRSTRFIYADNNGTKTRTLINPQRRIMELTSIEFRWNFLNPLSRGIFNNGVIFLRENHWCKKTLNHESLHSFQNIEFEDKPELKNMIEGLTEFFTGYLLFKECIPCYNSWLAGTYSICSPSYLQWVKMYGAFCHFLPINLLKNLYFQDEKSWDERYNSFLTTIQQSGFPTFSNPFEGKRKVPLELRFLQEFHSSFGKQKFNSFFNSKEKCLNFKNMIGEM